MNDKQVDELFEAFRTMAGSTHDFEVKRSRVQHGRTFSEDAMEELILVLKLFVGGRIMHRWDKTGEPPTAVKVTVTVVAQ